MYTHKKIVRYDLPSIPDSFVVTVHRRVMENTKVWINITINFIFFKRKLKHFFFAKKLFKINTNTNVVCGRCVLKESFSYFIMLS